MNRRAAVAICVLGTGIGSRASAQPARGDGRADLTGKILTVNGPIAPMELGETLMHEHLFIDIRFPDRAYPRLARGMSDQEKEVFESARFAVPSTPERLAFWNREVWAPDLLDGLRKGWMTKAWLRITDSAAVRWEVEEFKRAGGNAIVDATPIGLRRDPVKIRAVARATGLHVVMGSGWYRWP